MSSVAREGIVHRDRGRKPNGLPTHSSNGVNPEARRRSPLMPWTDPGRSSLPKVPARRLHIPLSNVRYADQLYGRRVGRKQSGLLLCLFVLLIGCIFFALVKYFRHGSRRTVVFGRENLQKIWKWEIASGHHPSTRQSMQTWHVLTAPVG
jgi:WD repeat and SOF domain-containing protein 1